MDPQLVSREETLSLHNPPSPPKLTMALLLLSKLNIPMGDTATSNKQAFLTRVQLDKFNAVSVFSEEGVAEKCASQVLAFSKISLTN